MSASIAPREMFIEFSICPDGGINVEDWAEYGVTSQFVRYVRADDIRWLVQSALADIACEAIQNMSGEAINSTILAKGDDPELVAERVQAIIRAALGGHDTTEPET